MDQEELRSLIQALAPGDASLSAAATLKLFEFVEANAEHIDPRHGWQPISDAMNEVDRDVARRVMQILPSPPHRRVGCSILRLMLDGCSTESLATFARGMVDDDKARAVLASTVSQVGDPLRLIADQKTLRVLVGRLSSGSMWAPLWLMSQATSPAGTPAPELQAVPAPLSNTPPSAVATLWYCSFAAASMILGEATMSGRSRNASDLSRCNAVSKCAPAPELPGRYSHVVPEGLQRRRAARQRLRPRTAGRVSQSMLESGRLVSDVAFSSNEYGGALLSITPGTLAANAVMTLSTFDVLLQPTTAVTLHDGGVDVQSYITTQGLAVDSDDVSAHLTSIDANIAALNVTTGVTGLVDALQTAAAAGGGISSLMPKMAGYEVLPDFEVPDEFNNIFDPDLMSYAVANTTFEPAGSWINALAILSMQQS
ncbi:hypothetical protein JKP88DRAFT_247767 [Tribonema minus]|uniref:Uncharacterized protein n=1 Tax=Tribonema minus TaxID=303371 RepID=A0A835YPR2_9STRA|nr:hypothetical protein JKP88DRAFT_247767 [Tribonema minus]